MKKLIVTTILAVLALLAVPAAAAAFGASGAGVIAEGVDLVKSGLIGEEIHFRDTDFKSALAVADFKHLTVHTLPSSADGALMLGNKRVTAGQRISRRSIPNLYFIPQGDEVTECSFTFSIDAGSKVPVNCRLRFIESVNYAPKIDTGTDQSLTVTTQSGISVWGMLNATDPEGDKLTYQLIRYPTSGLITVMNDGEFKYTPSGTGSFRDSFVFTVRDEYGNYAAPSTVNIKVTERMSEIVFADMTESKSYNAAVAMAAMGIMSGNRLGDDMYFNPDGTVTRAEFVAMAMKALGIKADTTLTATYFDDNEDIPSSLVAYVATAARCGIVNGAFDGQALKFRPKDAITACEAAIILSNLTELKSTADVFADIEGIEAVPVWARGSVGAMFEAGIFDTGTDIDLKAALTREEVAEYLYRIMLR